MSIDSFSKKTGLKVKTIQQAAEDGRIRSRRNEDGSYLIPDDEIRPLTKAQIQSLLYAILRTKNDPKSKPDISKVDDIGPDSIKSALKQLTHREYLDSINVIDDIHTCFLACRITEKGMELVERDPLPGGWIKKTMYQTGTETVVQTLLNLLIEFLIKQV